MRDTDVSLVRLCPANAELLAVLTEERTDMSGPVREEVARIRILRSTARGQVDREPVDDATAIRVDQPAKELTRTLVDEGALPPGERERPRVLLTQAMLRKYVWPTLPAGLDDSDTAPRTLVHAPMRNNGSDSRGG
jgi:hypothetical protein